MAKPITCDTVEIDEIRTVSDSEAGLSEHDRWLLSRPEILASVVQGLEDSAAGRVRKRPSYAQYADDNLDD